MSKPKYIINHKPSSSEKHVNEFKLQTENHSTMLLKARVQSFPVAYTLSSKYTLNILDQGALGSCVVNSFASIINSYYNVNTSRLYHYYICRVGTNNLANEDSGLDLLQSIPLLQSYGLVAETFCPYNTRNYSISPPLIAYKNADTTKAFKIVPISQTETAIKTSLSNSFFVMLGIMVYDSFLSSQVALNGLVPMPDTSKEKIQGGHCIHIVGWCVINNVSYFIIRNSWGKSWGNDGNSTPTTPFTFRNNGTNGGYCYIPFTYILNNSLAFELCQVTK